MKRVLCIILVFININHYADAVCSTTEVSSSTVSTTQQPSTESTKELTSPTLRTTKETEFTSNKPTKTKTSGESTTSKESDESTKPTKSRKPIQRDETTSKESDESTKPTKSRKPMQRDETTSKESTTTKPKKPTTKITDSCAVGQYLSVPISSTIKLPCSVHVGTRFVITGTIAKNAESFKLYLANGSSRTSTTSLFFEAQLSPSKNQNPYVILKDRSGGVWSSETKITLNSNLKNSNIVLEFELLASLKWNIKLNGNFFATYSQKYPLTMITNFSIDDDISVKSFVINN